MAPSRAFLAACVLALLAVAGIGTGVESPGRPGPPEPVPDYAPVVAVWSARRLPERLATSISGLRLPLAVEAALGPRSRSCFVLEEGSRRVFAHQARRPLIPASTQKLLVAAAALSVFGPHHRFETRVVATGPLGPTVDRLWLVGGGDPVLAVRGFVTYVRRNPVTRLHPATSLERLADGIAARGVREVGALLVDPTRHTGSPTVPTWKPSYVADGDVSRLSALTVNGGWEEWKLGRRAAADPAVLAGTELARLLRKRGVTVTGPPVRGRVPAGRTVTVASVRSPSLEEIVAAMVRESDNTVAEILTREVGRARRGRGTTEAGTEAVVEELAALGIDVRGVRLTDGSGLDRGNAVTCQAILQAVDLRHQERFRALDAGLAVAGRTGTLARRLRGTPLEGVLRAKTGSLAGVVGLVGVLDDSPPLTFAMLANGPFSPFEGLTIQERVARVLDDYPFEFGDPAVLAPPPARPRPPAEGNLRRPR